MCKAQCWHIGRHTPFVHIFEEGEALFAYDVNANQFMQITPHFRDLIESLEERSGIAPECATDGRDRFGDSAAEDLEVAKESGLFSTHRPTIYDPLADRDRIEWLTRYGVRMVTLIVAETCNLRCRYCPSVIRPRSDTGSMSFMGTQTARQAVDFLLAHSSEVGPTVTVGFYGGEPLLNREVIDDTIEYASRTGRPRKVNFTMTTNGVLLSVDFVRFLVEQDVATDIVISVDGPPTVHDANRVTSDGQGTFETVYGNLMDIRGTYPEWFSQHVSFRATLAPPYELALRRSFFAENPLSCSVQGGMVSQEDLNQYLDGKRAYEEASRDWDQADEELVASLVGNRLRKDSDGLWPVAGTVLSLKRIWQRSTDGLAHRHPRDSVCFLGTDRTTVAPDGSIHACSRLFDRSCGKLVVGDVNNGLDVDRIFDLRKTVFAPFLERCGSCWAVRFCDLCCLIPYVSAHAPDEAVERECRAQKKAIEADFRLYCRITRENPVALDQL